MSRGSSGNFEQARFERKPHPDYRPYKSRKEHLEALVRLIIVGLVIGGLCMIVDAIFWASTSGGY